MVGDTVGRVGCDMNLTFAGGKIRDFWVSSGGDDVAVTYAEYGGFEPHKAHKDFSSGEQGSLVEMVLPLRPVDTSPRGGQDIVWA